MNPHASDASAAVSDVLGFQGEGEWLRLRRQLELAEGFWLGFLFTPSPAVSALLANRTEMMLRARERSLRRIRPNSPATLCAALAQLFDETSVAGCVWLEAIKVDPPGRYGESPGSWTAAWDDLLLRLNERRERIRRHLGGGLVLVAPLSIKGRARNAAPDLWSIRDLVLEPQPLALQRETAIPRREIDSEPRSRAVTSVDPVAFEPAHDGRRSQAGAGADAMELLREAEGLLLGEEARKAISPAALAVEILERADAGTNEDDRLATALATLARAEAADGDVAAALEHIRRAVELREEKPPKRSTLLWFELWGELATEAFGDLAQAGRVYENMLILSRQLLERDGEMPQALRDLSVILEKLGGVRELAGDTSGASAAYAESLEIRRRILDSYGETPQALRDLLVILEKLGGVSELPVAPASTNTPYVQGLAISRRILDFYGETPQALRDFSVSLERLGGFLELLGHHSGASATYAQSLAISRRILDSYGETPQALRDLFVSLEKLGGVRELAADPLGAKAAYEESLAISRRILDSYGETPQALSDLAFSLQKVADVNKKLGDVPAADKLLQELSALRNKLAGPAASSSRS